MTVFVTDSANSISTPYSFSIASVRTVLEAHANPGSNEDRFAVRTGHDGLTAIDTNGRLGDAVAQPPVFSYPPFVIDQSVPLPNAVLAVADGAPDMFLADNPALAYALPADGTTLTVADDNAPPASLGLASFNPALTDAVFADAPISPWVWALGA